jgi:hypothetical protein
MSENDQPAETTGTTAGDVYRQARDQAAAEADYDVQAGLDRLSAWMRDDSHGGPGLENVRGGAVLPGAHAHEPEEAGPLPAQQGEPAPGAADRDAAAAGDRAGGASELTVREVSALAIRAHSGQTLSSGAPYREHLRTVAEALTQFGPLLEMAGWLHDILERTTWTAEELHVAGVPDRVVEIVERVTHFPGTDYLDTIRRITQDPEATLVKIADNADSIRPERGVLDDARRRLLADWEQARVVLWPATTPENVTAIVGRVNPPLLEGRSADRS